MKGPKQAALVFVAFSLAVALPARAAGADEEALLRIEGAYLAYSYDHGQVFGERVAFKLGAAAVESRSLRIDFPSRTFLASGGVTLRTEGEVVTGDELLFDVEKKTGVLFRYGETIETAVFPGPAAPSKEDVERARAAKESLETLTLSRIRDSFVYFTAKTIEVLPGYEVVGYDVVTFLEGVTSVGFRKFKLSLGEKQKTDGLALDKIWFNRSQGLFANVSYSLEREKALNSLTQFRYEEHSILKSYAGLPRQVELQTDTTWTVNERTDLGLNGNYNSTGLWNARLFADRRLGGGKGHILFDFAFNKPLERREEAWLGVQSSLNSERWGTLLLSGKVEVHNQALGNLAYSVAVLKRLRFSLSSNYSRLQMGGTGGMSHIFTGEIGLSYNADGFNAAADYYLNRDLVGNQRLLRPQLRVALAPFTFYGGLLTATIQNVFLSNDLRTSGATSRTYNDNLGINLTAQPVYLRPGFSLQAGAAIEQFLEKEGRNFTSGGLILRSVAEFSPSVLLEGYYSVQSRRRTRGRLIEGTTSQDLTSTLRIRPGERLNGWVTVSYDPKAGEWKQSYADLAVGLIRNWEIQTLVNYDFFRRKPANIDLYLVRHAGRFDLRFIWRSISRQVLIELVPALGPRRGPNSEPPGFR